jgi:galactokinase
MTARAYWAPGRVNLIGEFTDLCGGPVLPAALDLGVRIEAVPGEKIELCSHELGGVTRLEPDGAPIDGELDGWTRYAAAVAAELALLGRPPVGLEGEISSTLPIGAGLSSSAALEVAIALALCDVAGFELKPLELAQAARRAEHRAVGVPCGVLDQAASILGRESHALLLDTGTLAYEYVPLPAGIAIVIVDSGVSRRLERSGYKARREELERALAKLGERDHRSLASAEVGEIAAAAGVDEVAARRLRHVVSERERVHEVASLLRKPSPASLRRLGEVFREGHESLRRDFEATIPELDLLVDLASERGAIAARMTGGGFGGSIVALTDELEVEEFVESVVAAYELRGEARANAYVCRASGGAGTLG